MAAQTSENRTITSVEARKSVLRCFKKQRPVFLWGPPGIGKSELVDGITDELGYRVADQRVGVSDLHATLLHQFGLDHRRLTFPHAGRMESLSDSEVTGADVVHPLLA